ANLWETRYVSTPSVGSGPRAYTCALVGATYGWQPLGIDDNGNLTVPGALGAGSLAVTGNTSLTGNLTVAAATILNTLAATQATISGATTVGGLLSANSATISNALSAGSASISGALSAS